MAHSLPHHLKNLCHGQITTAHWHLSIYVHIVFMKFHEIIMRTATLCAVFLICLKPDTKRGKPHGIPSTWPLEDQELYITCHSHWRTLIPTLGKIYSQNAFPSQWHTRNIPALNNTAQWHWDIQGTAWQRDFYEILTISLRDLYEIGILQGKPAGHGSRDPFYSSLLCSTPL